MAAEKQFENKVKKFLTDQGCWLIKYWAGAAYTKSGVPDLLVCVRGHFMAVELKAANGRPSDLQIWNLRKVSESDGIAILLYPKDYDQFKEFVTGICAGEEPAYSKYPFLNEWKKYRR